MQQIVNHTAQQFSFDDYIINNGLEKYFALSHEFNDGYFNASAKKRPLKNFFNRIQQAKNKIIEKTVSVVVKDEKKKKKVLAFIDKTQKLGEQIIKKAVFGTFFAAYITLIRVNFAKQAARLYPGLLTEKEAREKGYDIENWKKTVAALKKIEKVLENWGGAGKKDKEIFRKAVKMGHDKPPFRGKARAKREKAAEQQMADRAKQQNQNFDSIVGDENSVWFNVVESAVIVAAIGAGSSILGIVSGIISKAGVKKNPYTDGKEHPGLEGDDEEIPKATIDQQKENAIFLIESDPDLSPEEKKERIAQVDEALGHLNDPKIQQKALDAADKSDAVIYGGIAVGVIVLSIILYFALKPKTA